MNGNTPDTLHENGNKAKGVYTELPRFNRLVYKLKRFHKDNEYNIPKTLAFAYKQKMRMNVPDDHIQAAINEVLGFYE